jgi:uncharacterized protein (DUF2336 family)
MGAIDSEYLFELARHKSSAERTRLAETVSDLFEERKEALSDRERSLMFDILHAVIHDVETSVRKTLSERLAAVADAPRDLIRVLANNEIEVASPVLMRSEILSDEDLIEVIRNRTLEHKLAITQRNTGSEVVSDVLVGTGNESVICSLLSNPNSRISKATMEYIVEQSKRVDTFQEPILRRQDLDPALAKRMFVWVSAVLRQHIIENFDIDAETIDQLLEVIACEEFKAAPKNDTRKSAELAKRLEEEGMATPDMMLDALREGEVPLFTAMFCRMSGLSEPMFMRILFDPGGEGLAIACKAVGLGKAVLSSIYTISRKARPESVKGIRRETRRLLNFFDHMSEDAAKAVLERWKTERDHRAAIRELEVGT